MKLHLRKTLNPFENDQNSQKTEYNSEILNLKVQ